MNENDRRAMNTLNAIRVHARAIWLDRARLRIALPLVAGWLLFAVATEFFTAARGWL